MLIGGGDRRDPEHRVLRYFVAEAGGEGAKILVLAVASREPREALDEYLQLLKRFGAASV